MKTPKAGQAPDSKPPVYPSNELFQGGTVVIILHAGREYRLQITSTGKLILTA